MQMTRIEGRICEAGPPSKGFVFLMPSTQLRACRRAKYNEIFEYGG